MVFIASLYSLTMTQHYEIEKGAPTEGQNRTHLFYFIYLFIFFDYQILSNFLTVRHL